jgi:hypothetical protein
VNRSVTNPVDFVTALVVDGKAINLANFWRDDDISAGDDLVLFLEERPYETYTLSHNPRSRKTVQFEPLGKWKLHTGVLGTGRECNPRLVGVRHNLEKAVEAELFHTAAAANWRAKLEKSVQGIVDDARKRGRDGAKMSGSLFTETPEAVFQLVPGVASSPYCGMRGALWNDGFWHIARSQVIVPAHFGKKESCQSDLILVIA